MYFVDRADAGKQLALKLEAYKTKNIIVVALDPTSAVVAAQVAMKLHSSLLLYVVRDISLPGEKRAVAGMGSGDVFTFNKDLSEGQRDEITMEYRSYIEQRRREVSHELHMLLGESGEINKDMLRHRTVILVSDGLGDGFKLGVVSEYLKTVAIERLVIAAPFASVPAVDTMHLVADEICCLSVIENYFDTDHYYEHNEQPDIAGVQLLMKHMPMTWDLNAFTAGQ